MRQSSLIVTALMVSWTAPLTLAAESKFLHTFERIQLTNVFFSEGAAIGDLNRDGAVDIVSGPYWYAGPDFTKRHEYYPAKPFQIDEYSDNFLSFVHDVNDDGWPDILVVGFPGKEATWFQNPQGKPGLWTPHLIHATIDSAVCAVPRDLRQMRARREFFRRQSAQ